MIRLLQTREFVTLAAATVIFAALPFVIVAMERLMGLLSSEAAWQEQGWNHGPWRWEIEGFTILYPLALLGIVTIFHTVRRARREPAWDSVSPGLMLLAVQFLLIIFQARTLFWLID